MQKRILKSIKPINKTEKINTKDCLNRILSKSIKAKRTQPEFNTSAMDGYAIRKSFLKKIYQKILTLLEKLKLVVEINSN